MGSFKRNHPIPKEGEIIEITKRNCTEKVQPRFKVGMRLTVVNVNTTLKGIMLLEVAHPEKKNEILHVNASRFDWRIVQQSELGEERFKADVKSDTEKLMSEFTQREQTTIAFVPLIIETLIWRYADKCVEYCAENRISETVKLSRSVRMLKKKWEEKISLDLNSESQYQVQSETERFVEFCGNDFTIFYFSVNRELIKHNPDMQHENLATYALQGMALIKFLNYFNAKIFKLIKERMGRENVIATDPIFDALNASFDAYAGNYKDFDFKANDIVSCIKILEIKLGQIEFNVVKDR